MFGLSMKVSCKTGEVLSKLKENRSQHSKIVVEARKGYVERARKVLEKRLIQLKEGKIVDLIFRLSPPLDNTWVYDTAIQMLELHQGDTIDLTGTEVRQLIQDEWDWTNAFLEKNSVYSDSANLALASKGRSIEEELELNE